jgi:hypothetical protein
MEGSLANQLYQQSTHFLEELIQNADDNVYADDVEPQLEIGYNDDHIRIDCNEVGFSRENIDAICKVGQSSKKHAGEGAFKQTGEKGIGFKSVFRVAQTAWVASGNYTFKFDTNEPFGDLGMIHPVWATFPAARRPGWTSILLNLRAQTHHPRLRDEILAGLQHLDPRILAFLRKLRRIAVTINSQTQPGIHGFELGRVIRMEGDQEVMELSRNEVVSRYLLHKHTAPNLPRDSRRGNATDSDIHVAFPIDGNDNPVICSQQVYSFLPVGDFGFNFLLQGDFILTANREGFQTDNEWNTTLRRAAAAAFLGAVRQLNSGPMRYVWPRFIAEAPGPNHFFRDLKTDIIAGLKNERLIEAWNETLQPPTALVFVPDEFRDRAGNPLTLTHRTEYVYVSRQYTAACLDFLKRLGVVEMDSARFTRDLTELVSRHFDDFRERPASWHADLAAALNRVCHLDHGPLRHLRLIKLRTGSWISVEGCGGRGVLFPGHSGQVDIPQGLGLLVVDPEAAASLPRRQLYSRLGVHNFSLAAIEEKIVQWHISAVAPSAAVAELVSHLSFLFSTHWLNQGNVLFWVATEGGNIVRSTEAYMDWQDHPLSATTLFAGERTRFKFLHSEYRNAHLTDPEGWTKWLEKNVRLSRVPRLNRWHAPSCLGADFLFVVGRFPPATWLKLICEHWDDYKRLLDPAEVEGISRGDFDILGAGLRALPIIATDGTEERLSNLHIPLPDMTSASQDLAKFIPIPEPEHTRWQNLKHLGVGVRNDIRFYLGCLQRLGGTETTLGRFQLLLTQVQAHCREDPARVRSFFRGSEAPLILVPPQPSARQGSNPRDEDEFQLGGEDADDAPGEWRLFRECLWRGSPHLRMHCCLATFYPGFQQLFRDVLELSDMTVPSVTTEIKSLRRTGSIDVLYILGLLAVLDRFLVVGKMTEGDRRRLLNRRMWPVRMPDRLGRIKLRTLRADDDWLIADVDPERECFAHLIPILEFDVSQQHRFRHLSRELGLHTRAINQLRSMVPGVRGQPTLHQQYTDSFRSKYPFFARLAQMGETYDEEDKRVRLAAMRQVRVDTTAAFDVVPVIWYRGRELRGRPIEGSVSVAVSWHGSDGHNPLEVLMTDTYFQDEVTPDRLVAEFMRYLGLRGVNCAFPCLQYILMRDDPSDIRAYLDRHGVPELSDRDDGDDDWLNEMGGLQVGDAAVGRGQEQGRGQGQGQGREVGGDGIIVMAAADGEGIATLLGRTGRGGDAVDGNQGANAAAGIRVLGPGGVGQETFHGLGMEDRYFDEELQYLGESKVRPYVLPFAKFPAFPLFFSSRFFFYHPWHCNGNY